MDSNTLIINKDTNYAVKKDVWVQTEVYLYGEVFNAGGKGVSNIHIDTGKSETIKIKTNKDILGNYEENPLYKVLGVKANAMQNISDGSLKDVSFIEFIKYHPKYDEADLNKRISQATPQWAGVTDPDNWVKELRTHG